MAAACCGDPYVNLTRLEPFIRQYGPGLRWVRLAGVPSPLSFSSVSALVY
jgi:hypothetical protein